MRIRLIGLGDVGAELVFAACRYFHDKGLDAFLERRLVVKTTTEPFVQAFDDLRAALLSHAPHLVAGTSLVSLQQALGCLFFSGRTADLESRWNTIILGSRQVGDAEEHLAASRYFARLHRDLDGPTRRLFLQLLRVRFDQHLLEVQNPPVPNFEPDWLIVPTMPMTSQLNNTLPLIGRELATAIPELDFRRGRIVQGLGIAGSQVDAVALVFSLNDTFAAEGAQVICAAIRRALQPREANRILAILGFGVYETPPAPYTAGRYLAEHFRLSRGSATFDGLLTSPNTVLSQNFPPVLASVAVSSTPETVQIDNPDANQVQRDFGRGLVGFGYCEGNQTALQLYQAALQDWAARHSEPEGPRRNVLLNVFQAQVAALQQQGLPIPDWATALATGPPAEVEKRTARKVIIYLGHDERLGASDLQALRDQVETDFPRARTVFYKYELPPSIRPPTPAASLGTKLRKIFHGISKSSPLPEAQPPITPRPQHVSLFVVDGLQTRALGCFADYLRWSISAVAPNGQTVPPGLADQQWAGQKQLALMRGLLDYPNAEAVWPTVDSAGLPRLRTLLAPSILGGTDPTAVDAFSAEAGRWLGGESSPDDGALQAQAAAIEITVGQAAQAFILAPRRVAESLVNAKWVADAIAGLNVFCNDEVARRQVAVLIADLVHQVQK